MNGSQCDGKYHLAIKVLMTHRCSKENVAALLVMAPNIGLLILEDQQTAMVTGSQCWISFMFWLMHPSSGFDLAVLISMRVFNHNISNRILSTQVGFKATPVPVALLSSFSIISAPTA